MSSQEQLADLFHRRRLSADAIAMIENIRQSEPSRILRSGTHNVVTHYTSRKMGCVIKAEARRTELAAIFQWDHDDVTHEFYDQPPAIKKIHDLGNGKTRSHLYTPDFFRIAEDFVGWVECKAEGWLREQATSPSPHYIQDKTGTWRCPAAERFAHAYGLDYTVRSSVESDPIVIQNISDLSDYYREDCPEPTIQQLKQIQDALRDGWCWLRDLLKCGDGPMADAIYKLIADEKLHVDLRVASLMREPHRVRVFRTRALLESSEIWFEPLLATSSTGIRSVTPTSGSAVVWDGSAWEIVNAGDTEIFLRRKNTDGKECVQRLPVADFEQLVGTGSIAGTTAITNPQLAAAGARLCRATAEDIRSAMHRYYCIHPELCPPTENHLASSRAIRKWKRFAQQGLIEYGNEFVGLLPQIHDRGNRARRLPPRVLEIIHEVIDQEVQSSTAPGNFNAWSLVVNTCRKEGLMLPSRKTFTAEIQRVTTPEALKKAREGEKAGYSLELPFLILERDTPKHGTRPFDIAHIDHTQLDLQLVNEATGAPMGKPWLTVMIDAYTRMILAWVLLFVEPSYRSCMLVLRDCVRRHHRLPRTLVSDQGREFLGTYYEQLLAMFGVNKRTRPASQPRFGNIIERVFGVQNSQFTLALIGNNKALQSPRSMSPTHDPRDLAVWNLRAFRESFDGYLGEVYHQVEHPALGISPTIAMEIGMVQSGERSHTLIPYDQNFLILSMPTNTKGTSRVQRDGSIKVNRIDYFSNALLDYVGQNIPVRYDPFDVSHAYALGKLGWIEATSMYRSELAGRSEKEIEAISQEINEVNRRDGVREKDRAALLGAYLQKIRGREAKLKLELQRTRDRELRSTDQDVGLLTGPADSSDTLSPSPLSPPHPSPSEPTKDVGFDSISQEAYKDF
ncbi:Mu transposase C-terminal domain-containing protein [Hylemonella gracilis]|nr:Mu transposase C-terminal domain-containing protein [Hylemonella gracilis]